MFLKQGKNITTFVTRRGDPPGIFLIVRKSEDKVIVIVGDAEADLSWDWMDFSPSMSGPFFRQTRLARLP